jgi:hypothetical protein
MILDFTLVQLSKTEPTESTVKSELANLAIPALFESANSPVNVNVLADESKVISIPSPAVGVVSSHLEVVL